MCRRKRLAAKWRRWSTLREPRVLEHFWERGGQRREGKREKAGKEVENKKNREGKKGKKGTTQRNQQPFLCISLSFSPER